MTIFLKKTENFDGRRVVEALKKRENFGQKMGSNFSTRMEQFLMKKMQKK